LDCFGGDPARGPMRLVAKIMGGCVSLKKVGMTKVG
jgi:hypothetical protein